MKTKTQEIQDYWNQSRQCAMQMMQNALYIQKELPSLTMPDELRGELTTLCANLIGTKHDVVQEIFELDELLRTSPESPAIDAGIHQINSWILQDMASFHACVLQIQQAVNEGLADALLSMLVMESGANILNQIPRMPEFLMTADVDINESINPSLNELKNGQ